MVAIRIISPAGSEGQRRRQQQQRRRREHRGGAWMAYSCTSTTTAAVLWVGLALLGANQRLPHNVNINQ